MAANKGGDTKNGLIIALVCFVLLSIALGVTAYYGYADNATDRAKAKEAEGKATTMAKNRDWYKYLYLSFRKASGHANPKDENDLNQLGNAGLSDEIKTEVDKVLQDLKDKLVREKGKDPTAEYYADKVNRLDKELQAAKNEFAASDTELKKARARIGQMTKDGDDERKDWKDKLDKANAQNLKDRTDLQANFTKMLDEFGDLNKKLGDLTKKAEYDREGDQKKQKKLASEYDLVRKQLLKVQEALKPPDLLKYDTPKGAVVRLDPKGEVAWINIGSADNLRAIQSVTFSIFSASTGGRVGGERKGALEVVDVTGPHLAIAKIIEVTDANRDPITPGDLLINPAWSPTNQTHVAISGLIDMTGEGRDESDEFMRTLKREGIVVDSYLDLRDTTVKGDGITLKTDYLILGEAPDLTTSFTYKKVDTEAEPKVDARLERKKAISTKMAEMQKQALELGVTIVPLRRFALLTGYRLPRGVGVGTGAGYDFIRPSETLSAPDKQPAKKNGKAEPKQESKDKDNEDKDK